MKAGVNAPGYNNALGELDRWLVETVVAFTKMERTVQFLLGVSVCIALSGCSRAHPSNVDAAQIRAKLDAIPLDRKVDLTNKEWLVILSPQQFYVMRRAGTELPSLSGNALDHHNGTYVCSACGNPLYGAETKFNSGTGWPSFWQPIRKEAVRESSTSSVIFGVEISCARCGSHLGHVFNDGPPPTGLRYCMNAVALMYREASPGSVTASMHADQNRH